MIEVLWHGRGGQGAFTAARLLGAAASSEDGIFAIAFPSFGPERRGAPMRAYTKIDDSPIGDRSEVTQADFVIYLDDTLLTDDWEQELKPEGIALVNSAKRFMNPRIFTLDANALSESILGHPIPNTVFLGALVAFCDLLTMDAVKQAIKDYMPPKLHESNQAIVEEAFSQALTLVMDDFLDETIDYLESQKAPAGTRGCHQEFNLEVAGDPAAPSADSVEAEVVLSEGDPDAAEPVADYFDQDPDPLMMEEPQDTDGLPSQGIPGSDALASSESQAPDASSSENPEHTGESSQVTPAVHSSISVSRETATPDICIPHLRKPDAADPSLAPEDYAKNTCYAAGHLVAKNAGWRHVRPVINQEICTGCLQCYLYCPDGTIFKVPVVEETGDGTHRQSVAVDYDFCKGCGICARVCKFDAITMISEQEAVD